MDRADVKDDYSVAQVDLKRSSTSKMKVNGKTYHVAQDSLKRQSIQEADGSRVSSLCPDGELTTKPFGECSTLTECFLRGLRLSEADGISGRCLGWRPGPDQPYKWLSYREVYQRAKNFGAGLVHKGLNTISKPFLGIYSQNRSQWMIAAEGAWMNSLAIVPLYDTLGPEACAYIVNQAELCTVLCDTADRARHLVSIAKKAQEENAPRRLQRVILVEEPGAKLMEEAEACQVQICSFEEILTLGAVHPVESLPKSSDLAVVCYTSGTTGNPKGAMITHGNYCSTAAGVISHMSQGIWRDIYKFGVDDCHLSYLPLAHTFEQVVINTMIAHGSSIGFFQGNIKLLTDDLQTLRPTIFPTVPRLLNRIYDGVMNKAKESKLKESLLKFALKRKQMDLDRGIFRRNSIWDKIVFKQIHQKLGGRVRVVFSGSAPLSGKVMQFARCALGALILEGFGQTENAAICTTQIPGDLETGVVGPPLPHARIRLVDVPEKDCWTKDGRGEICVKGPCVFAGYLKDPEKTAEVLDDEGWLHTGDIGAWTPNGALKVIDRKKHIFKLAQGEYIAPEKIENVYLGSAFVAQIFVYGESLKSNLVAVVIPERETVEEWANSNIRALLSGDRGDAQYESLVKDPRLKSAILADMIKVAKKGGLKTFETAKDIVLDARLWSIEDGTLTPTFKTKRAVVKHRFAVQIDNLYERLD